jgi:hypothetical protein
MTNLAPVPIYQGFDIKALATTFNFKSIIIDNALMIVKILTVGKTQTEINDLKGILDAGVLNLPNVDELAVTQFKTKPPAVPDKDWVGEHLFVQAKIQN